MLQQLTIVDASPQEAQRLLYHSDSEKLDMLELGHDRHRQRQPALHDICTYLNLVLAIAILVFTCILLVPVKSIDVALVATGSHPGHEVEDWNRNPTDFSHTIAEGWKDCGHSPEEARAKGCVYDVMLVAWLHADCFDRELHETYLSDTDWPFWIDRGLEHAISLDEVRLGQHRTVFSNQEFHLAHCSYFLEQSVRGFRDGRGVVDNVTLDREHTEHCARTLRDVWLPEMGYSPLHMDWHSCGRPAA